MEPREQLHANGEAAAIHHLKAVDRPRFKKKAA
jgi:hypothetical protein